MYIDYNMAEIALMICAFSSLMSSVGGGFYMFKQEQKKEIDSREEGSCSVRVLSRNVIIKGRIVIAISYQWIGEATMTKSGITYKSIIVPAGFSVETYPKQNKGGFKLTHRWSIRLRSVPLSNQWLSRKSNLGRHALLFEDVFQFGHEFSASSVHDRSPLGWGGGGGGGGGIPARTTVGATIV